MADTPILRTALLVAAALLPAACGKGGSQVPDATVSDVAPVGLAPPAAPTPSPAPGAPPSLTPEAGRSVKVSNDLYEFEYAYPAKVGAIAGLKAVLDRRLEAARRELTKGAAQDQAEAKKNDYPYRQHSSGAEWKVVADLPRWLSLSDEAYTYTGGAHGMTMFDSLLWDRQANRPLEPIALFANKAALSRAIRQPFCDLLDKERAKRRGEPVNRKSGDEFDECIDPVENTVLLGSTNGKTFDRIGILVGPYAAGSYAEGTYDITVPVTPAVLATVKPEYRGEFSVKR